jgi:DnaJ-class molecular chaperone
MPGDLYSILGLQKGADDSEIRKQYLKLSKQYHPDKVSDDLKVEYEEKFKEVSRAYEILKDDQQRAFYDQTGQIPGENSGEGPGMPFGMGGGMPFPFSMGGMGMNDIFGMFGRKGDNRPRRQGKAPPRKTQIPLGLKDFYFGRNLKIHLDHKRFCSKCNGEGSLNVKSCGSCGGSGSRTQVIQMGLMIMQNQVPCPNCQGSGKTKGDHCSGCNGSKFTNQEKDIELTVKKGMKHGDIITFPGESSQEEGYTEPGDVVIELVAADEDHGWERHGDNLRHRVNLSLGEALCGKIIRLDGHPAHDTGVYIQIPAGVQNRQEISVEGLGMPRSIGAGFGEVILHLSVMATKEEIELINNNIGSLRDMFKVSPGESNGTLIWSAKPLVY